MANLKDLTVEQFIDVTASDAPAPGGGSGTIGEQFHALYPQCFCRSDSGGGCRQAL